jgi:hypothetical protein
MGRGNNRPLARLGGRRARASFVLVEVLVSMTILGVAGMALLKSFSYSLDAARKMDAYAKAGFLAERLLDQFELNPPYEGEATGDFGEDFKQFSYRADVRYVDPQYDLEPPDDVEQFFPMRQARVEIILDDGSREPETVLTVDSTIMGLERFSPASKKSYFNF